jgi:uncharacterized Tic20 family protein
MSVPPPAPQGSDERTWGIFCHLSALAAITQIPLANILGPLIIWLVKKEQYPFVSDQGKEALNFQISMTIYFFLLMILTIPLFIGSFMWCFPFMLIAIPLGVALAITDLVLVIVASVAASNGQAYRYPLTIRFIR